MGEELMLTFTEGVMLLERRIAFSSRHLPRLTGEQLADRLLSALDWDIDVLPREVAEFLGNIAGQLRMFGGGLRVPAADIVKDLRIGMAAQIFLDAEQEGRAYIPPRTLAILKIIADPTMLEEE
jgi:hypothetical protein